MDKPMVIAAFRNDHVPGLTFGRPSTVDVTIEVRFKYGDHTAAATEFTKAFHSVLAQIVETAPDEMPNTNQAEV